MAHHRFYVSAQILCDERVCLEGGVAAQIRRVLRLRPGDEICLFCGDGWEHRVELLAVHERAVEGRIVSKRQPETEARASVWLAIAVLKGEKLEWVIQKGTELGAAGFLLMQTERTVVTAGEARWPARRERYARIAVEAAEQCGRVRIPAIEGPVAFADAIARAAVFDRAVIAHEGGQIPLVTHLSGVLWDPAVETAPSVLLLIGPEGGFAPDEVAAAEAAGVTVVSLGPRVLRAETAAVAGVALALSALE
jgi:16S rRNA (uracil1498-N3)-methyltransferase